MINLLHGISVSMDCNVSSNERVSLNNYGITHENFVLLYNYYAHM